MTTGTVFPIQPAGTRFDELIRRVRITTGSRFAAAKRLRRHHRFSQWTVTLLSVALILIPLLQALGVTTGMSTPVLNTVQVLLAVFVLSVSLLIGMEDHAVRADKMHRCGLELSNLMRHLETFRGQHGADVKYDEFADRYANIMGQYENHNDVDYLMFRLQRPKEFYPRKWPRFADRLKAYTGYWIEFLPYIGPLALLYIALHVMLKL